MSYLEKLLDTLREPARSRTARFMARLENHLDTLPEPERAAFVAGQLAKWQADYTAWAARIDTRTATPVDEALNAYDWLETIVALDAKAKALTREAA